MAEKVVVPILEIKDEFGTCEICLDDFNTEAKSPRTLPCFHTFCGDCLDKMWAKSAQGVRCPKCRKIWPVQESITASFQQNNMLMHLMEYIVIKKKPECVLCYKCPENNKATVRCIDCERYICQICEVSHAQFLEQHTTIPISELIDAPRGFFNTKGLCSVHNDKIVDVFCKSEACTRAICTTCALVSHKDHDICFLKDVYDAKKKEIVSSLEDLRKTSDECKSYKHKLEEQKVSLEKMQQDLVKDLDDYSSKLMLKIKENTEAVKRLVTEDIEKQKEERDEQITMVDQMEDLKAEHIVYCQQALEFARDVELIEMSKTLKTKSNSFTNESELPDFKVRDITLDTEAYNRIAKNIEKISILVNKATHSSDFDEEQYKLDEHISSRERIASIGGYMNSEQQFLPTTSPASIYSNNFSRFYKKSTLRTQQRIRAIRNTQQSAFGFKGFKNTATQPFQSPASPHDEEKVEEYEPNVIELPELVDVKTGEENEKKLFGERSHLYRFDTETGQWKERGIGEMKILESIDGKRFRILMRREQVLKICANHNISTDMKLTPMGIFWCWTAMDFSDESMKTEQLAVIFNTPDITANFKKVFENCQKQLADNPIATGTDMIPEELGSTEVAQKDKERPTKLC